MNKKELILGSSLDDKLYELIDYFEDRDSDRFYKNIKSLDWDIDELGDEYETKEAELDIERQLFNEELESSIILKPKNMVDDMKEDLIRKIFYNLDITELEEICKQKGI